MMPFLAALLGVVAAEVFARLSFAAVSRRFMAVSGKSAQTLRSPRISDHWKEQALMAYSARMMACSFKLLALLAILAVIVGAYVLGASQLADGFVDYAFGWQGLGISLVTAMAWFAVRGRLFHG